jgi:tetratricopeptide (TPR) repeat protein
MKWYPFRDIDGVKKANIDAAVNLDVANGTAKMGFYTTSTHAAAKVTLKAGDKVLLQETVAIDPGKPYTKQVALPAGTDEHDLVASISDGGKELVSYSPVNLTPETRPQPVTAPPPPADVKTNEELYLIGLRAQQFHDPVNDPMPYWEEALRRDPGDSRVNTVMGITAYSKAKYAEAEKYLRTAIARVTGQFTTPKDAEAIYYLGATLKAEGKTDEAYTYFYKATWSQAWKASGYYSLAEIAASRGDFAAALDFVDRSIDSNALNIRAQNLKAAVLRHTGHSREALQLLATAAHKIDPLDVRSMAERWLASKDAAAAKTLTSTMLDHPQTFQETAAEYLNAGLWKDGTDVLLQMVSSVPDKAKVHPMAYYYLGYFAEKLGQAPKASEYYRLALSMPPDYVFPFQAEVIDVLRAAIKVNPRDARASYYLGNLLYDWQPQEAATLWEDSAAVNPSSAIVHRNLATAYAHQKPTPDLNRAIAELEKAVSLDRKYPLHFAELDELYEQAGTPIEKRLLLFEKNQDVVAQRDDAQNRAVALKVAAGKYDDAIRMMTGRKFAVAEGSNLNIGEQWANAHILRGQQNIAAKKYKDALTDFEAAVTVPDNLPSRGFGEGGAHDAEVDYLTGLAYEGSGDRAKATESWKKAMASPGRRGAQSYYQALCLQKLSQPDKAKAMFQALVDSGQRALTEPAPTEAGRGRPQSPRLRTANAHYTIGLGYLGLGDAAKAKAELSQAVQTSPDLLGARTALAGLK